MTEQRFRHADQRLRSMEFAAACFVGLIFLAGIVCGFVLRPFVLGSLS